MYAAASSPKECLRREGEGEGVCEKQREGGGHNRVSLRVASRGITKERGGGPKLHEVAEGEGGILASPPVGAEVAVVEVADVGSRPEPVTVDGLMDEVNGHLDRKASRCGGERALVTKAANPPDAADDSDT